MGGATDEPVRRPGGRRWLRGRVRRAGGSSISCADGPSAVLLVAPENFFLFSPLLPEAASGTLEPRHAVIPLRAFLRGRPCLTGEVTSLDVSGRRAKVVDLNGDPHEIAFRSRDPLPRLAPTTLPVPGLPEYAVGFKTLPDVIWLRNHVLRQLEAAAPPTSSSSARAAHLHLHRRRLLGRRSPRRAASH